LWGPGGPPGVWGFGGWGSGEGKKKKRHRPEGDEGVRKPMYPSGLVCSRSGGASNGRVLSSDCVRLAISKQPPPAAQYCTAWLVLWELCLKARGAKLCFQRWPWELRVPGLQRATGGQAARWAPGERNITTKMGPAAAGKGSAHLTRQWRSRFRSSQASNGIYAYCYGALLDACGCRWWVPQVLARPPQACSSSMSRACTAVARPQRAGSNYTWVCATSGKGEKKSLKCTLIAAAATRIWSP
jgi:hypothetical protein